MKKKTLVALLLVLALACVPLVGCGESGKGYSTTTKLDLNDYTLAASDVMGGVKMLNSRKEFTTATYEDGIVETFGNERYGKKSVEGGYKLYDFVNHTGLYADKTYNSIVDRNNGLIECYVTNNDDSRTYDVYDRVNLKLLTTFMSNTSLTLDTVYGYVNGERTSAIRYAYRAGVEAEQSYKYFVKTEPTATERITYKEIAEADFKNSNVTAGSVIDANDPEEIYFNNAAIPYADMAGYTYTVATSDSGVDVMDNYTMVFFKDGVKCGELNIADGMPVGFVDKYLYYNEFQPVAHDAVKGYNFIVQDDENDNTTARKFNVTTYRYDVKKNKTSKINLGYIPFEGDSLYNYADKKYDAMYVAAFAKTDGVAVSASTTMLLIVDKDMKVGYDFTGKPFSFKTYSVSKLKENRFIYSDSSDNVTYIYNEKLEVVASFDTASCDINDNLGLVIFRNDGKTMAVDYDGKVVFENRYSNLDFYGDYAVASVTKDNGEIESDMIVGKNNLNGTEISKLDTERIINVDYSGIIAKADANKKYTFMNYSGTVLTTVTVEGSAYGNVESYFDSETGDQYALFHYTDKEGKSHTIVFTC